MASKITRWEKSIALNYFCKSVCFFGVFFQYLRTIAIIPVIFLTGDWKIWCRLSTSLTAQNQVYETTAFWVHKLLLIFPIGCMQANTAYVSNTCLHHISNKMFLAVGDFACKFFFSVENGRVLQLVIEAVGRPEHWP